VRARHVQALAALTVLAAILRFSTLSVQSYWFDEAVTVGLVKSSLGHMLSSIGGSESTPPLYYVLAWLWSHVFGTSEAGLRSLSALAGTAFVPVAYAVAATLASRRVALTIAALAAVNPLLIWYSQEARSYSLLVLLSALSFLLFARMLQRPEARTLVVWTVVSALALATHYFAGFLILPQAIWLIVRWPDRRQPAIAAGALVIVAGALVPLLVEQRSRELTSFIAAQSLLGRLLRVPKQFLIGYDAPIDTVLAIVAACLAAVGLWLLYAHGVERERRTARIAIVIAAAGVGIPLLLALCGADYLDTRNVLGAWLPALLLPALGFGARHAGRSGGLAALGLGGVMLFVTIAIWVNPSYQRDDNRGLARALGPATVPRAIVVTPAFAPTALRVYMKPFSIPTVAGLPVQEIDLVALPVRSAGLTKPATPPRVVPATPPGPGMKLVEKRFAKTYTLLRYRSPTIVPVTISGLVAEHLDPRVPNVMYQTPPPR
jgi:mannosyltransferase